MVSVGRGERHSISLHSVGTGRTKHPGLSIFWRSSNFPLHSDLLYRSSRHLAYHTTAPDEPRPSCTLLAYLSSGRIWDVYTGRLTVPERNEGPLRVAIKIASSSPAYRRPEGYLFNCGSEEIEAAASKEDALYNGPLRHLQGDVVPRYIGRFDGDLLVTGTKARGPGWENWSHVTVLVMEDVGDEVRLAQLVQRSNDTQSAYSKLHDCNVLHGDVEPRHVRVIGPRVVIIDWSESEHISWLSQLESVVDERVG